ncbi:MAG: hypothetical protein N2645_11215 [Clostridia bacterium]|nr:hypothetical protein [Clostridia bacterium]
MAKLDKEYYSQFNEEFVDRIGNTPQLLQEILNMPFPEDEEPIEHWGSDSMGGAEFFVDHPNQIVRMINIDYKDMERFGEDDDELLADEDRRVKEYKEAVQKEKDINSRLFVDLVALIEDELNLGETQYITSNGHIEDLNPCMPRPTGGMMSKFEASEYFFSSDRNLSAYWVVDDRIAFLQYAESEGDGEIQVYVTLGAVRSRKT